MLDGRSARGRAAGAHPGAGAARAFARLAGGFWRGGTAGAAWALSAAQLAAASAGVALQYGLNAWNGRFFDALERRDGAALLSEAALFALLVLAGGAVGVGYLRARMTFQVRWRIWLSRRLCEAWTGERRFHRLALLDPGLDAPESRIADDARLATEPVADMATGALHALLMACVFSGVLWESGGPARLGGVEFPGFMVLAALAYAAALTAGTLAVGRGLAARVGARNAAEAALRAGLARLRENAESVAMLDGGAHESRAAAGALDALAARWRPLVAGYARITWFTAANAVAAPVLPLLLLAPGYLEGRIGLGAVMQCAAAFVHVQAALAWAVDNYGRLAEWRGAAARVAGLWAALQRADAPPGGADGIRAREGTGDSLRLEALGLRSPEGEAIVAPCRLDVPPGHKLWLTGESGAGKSSLARAVAGLWPWGEGRVLLPRGARVAFLPQRPYLPVGTLREALCYGADPAPSATGVGDPAALALGRCGLGHLAPRLDERARWDRLLSGGEQQRLAFARLLLLRPGLVVMDEATSALDPAAQMDLMGLFRRELREATLLNIGHRPELEAWHDGVLRLRKAPGGSVLEAPAPPPRGRGVAAHREIDAGDGAGSPRRGGGD